MIMVNSVEKAQSLLDLALEISEVEQCGWKEALGRAIHLHPRLACDVQNDVRYGPPEAPIAVHTSWSVPPRACSVELPAVVVRAGVAALVAG